MGKKVPESAESKDKVEIVVSTYWPTRIIKSITIKDLTSDSSFHDSVTLSGKEAKYLFEQLATLYGNQFVSNEDVKNVLFPSRKENPSGK